MATASNVQNFTMYQGTDFSVTIDMFGDDGLPLDLTTYTGTGQMRPHYESEESHDLTVVTFNGGVTVSMSAAVNSLIEPRRYVYDVRLVDSYTQKTRPIKGRILLDPAATR